MKKLIGLFTAILTSMIVSTSVFASDESEFVFNDGCIEKYLGTEECVVIPQEIDGQQVTKIASSAFCGNESVKQIVIPQTVTQIWEDNMSDYGTYPFLDTPALEEITVDENNPCFKDIDGVLVDKTKGILLHYPQNKPGNTYTIPQEITQIRTLAFDAYNNLEQIYVYNDNLSFSTFSIGYGDLIINCHKGSTAEDYAFNSFKTMYIVDIGDINGDGIITASDASELLYDILSKVTGRNISDYETVCDVNADGLITADDCSEIMQIVLNG